jgi:hypothetical protein
LFMRISHADIVVFPQLAIATKAEHHNTVTHKPKVCH